MEHDSATHQRLSLAGVVEDSSTMRPVRTIVGTKGPTARAIPDSGSLNNADLRHTSLKHRISVNVYIPYSYISSISGLVVSAAINIGQAVFFFFIFFLING